MKVIFFSNFNAKTIFNEWQIGGHSAHHLWGKTQSEQWNVQIDILKDRKYCLLKTVSDKVKILGDLDREFRAFLLKDKYDLIYTVNPLASAFLSFLRSLGLFNKPIVTVANLTLKKNLQSRIISTLFFRGYDKIFCLSEEIKYSLENEFKISAKKLAILPWCIDINYQPFIEAVPNLADCNYVISTGKTYRDYHTLFTAFSSIDFDLEVIASGLKELPRYQSNNINICSKFIQTPQVIEKLKHAYAVAIPLLPESQSVYNAIGLTSLLEAMATSKPVIVTRYKYLGIDVEKEGIGLAVAPGDVRGWQKAVEYLLANPKVAEEMGRKGRKLVEQKYNLEVFTKELVKQLDSAM